MDTKIKIALSGQYDSDTKIKFTYPETFNPAIHTENDNWLKSLGDPRDVRVFNANPSAKEFFALWQNEFGYYYAVIVPNIKDTRTGFAMVTIFVGHNTVSSGNVLIYSLRELVKILVEDEKYDAIAINKILTPLDVYLASNNSNVSSALSVNKAFRTYSTDNELETIFQYPNQPEYDKYRRILIVPKTSVPANLVLTGYYEITSRVRKTYNVKNDFKPEVAVDKTTVMDGERLNIIYKKYGYKNETRTVTIDGNQQKEIYYDGADVIIQNAESVGISFSHAIKFNVRSQNDKIIERYTVDGKNVQIGEDYIFREDKEKYSIKIEARGCETLSVDVTLTDLIKGTKDVTLQPELKDVYVTLNIDGKTVKDKVSVSMNNKLYPYFIKNNIKFQPIIESHNGVHKGRNKKLHKLIKRIGFGLVAVVLICGCIIFCQWLENDESDQFETSLPEDTTANNTYSDTISDKKHDLDYLKKEDNGWKEDSLRTPELKKLIELINNCDIDDVISNSYKSERNVNGHWKNIVENIRTMRQDENFRDVEPQIVSAMMDCNCNVKQLDTDINIIKKNFEHSKDTSSDQNEVSNKNSAKSSKSGKKPNNSSAKQKGVSSKSTNGGNKGAHTEKTVGGRPKS
jgi:hypothetical protein